MSERSHRMLKALHGMKAAARTFDWESDKTAAADLITRWTELMDTVASRPGNLRKGKQDEIVNSVSC